MPCVILTGACRRFLPPLLPEDILILTGDHGCDPTTVSTDHSREYTPLLVAGPPVRDGVDLGTRATFGDIAATIADWLAVPAELEGISFLSEIMR